MKLANGSKSKEQIKKDSKELRNKRKNSRGKLWSDK